MEDVELHSAEEPEERQEVSDHANEQSEQTQSTETWMDTAWKVGETALFVADFLGEVFAEFFGMTQSRYQWAIDAYERQQRWEREEKEKEAYHKKLALEAMKKGKEEMKRAQAEMNPNDIKLAIIGGNEEMKEEETDEEPTKMEKMDEEMEQKSIDQDVPNEASSLSDRPIEVQD